MNIWIVNHYTVAPGSTGGSRHYDLAKTLTKQGCRVTLFGSSFEHQARKDLRLADSRNTVKEENINGVRFIWLKTRSYMRNDWRRIVNILQFTWRAYRYGIKKEESPDIVIGCLMHPLAALVGYLIARRKKCVFYFEERDLWPQTLIDLGGISKLHPVVLALGALELFLYRKAHRIILLFDKAADYVVGRGINRDKTVYLPNGVDLEADADTASVLPPETESRIQELEGKFLAVYTGSHGLANYLDALLDTAEELRQRNNSTIHFLFVGSGPEKAGLAARALQTGLTNVSFLPSIPKSAMPALLEKAGVGLISMKDISIYKWGMSMNKLYDYMAARLPTLILGKSESNIERSGGGLIAGTPREMADALERVACSPDLRQELGRKARAYVEENHAWSVLSARLLALMLEDLRGEGSLRFQNGKVSANEHN